MADEQKFIMDVIIYYLYYEIVNDKRKYPKNVPFVDLPQEIIDYLLKKTQKIFEKAQEISPQKTQKAESKIEKTQKIAVECW